MPDLLTVLTDLSRPVAICIAWIASEIGELATSLPRISFYGVTGFALAAPQISVLPPSGAGPGLFLADVAFDLVLFELAYRINPLFWMVQGAADIGDATLNSLLALLLSAGAGAVIGVAVTELLRSMGNLSNDFTVGFALAVILLVTGTHTAQLSPVVISSLSTIPPGAIYTKSLLPDLIRHVLGLWQENWPDSHYIAFAQAGAYSANAYSLSSINALPAPIILKLTRRICAMGPNLREGTWRGSPVFDSDYHRVSRAALKNSSSIGVQSSKSTPPARWNSGCHCNPITKLAR